MSSQLRDVFTVKLRASAVQGAGQMVAAVTGFYAQLQPINPDGMVTVTQVAPLPSLHIRCISRRSGSCIIKAA